MRTVRRLFNLLVLLSMALGLVLAPTSSVSADPSGPDAVDIQPVDASVWLYPPNAKSGVHMVVIFQVTSPVPYPGEMFIDIPEAFGMDEDSLAMGTGQDTDHMRVLISYDTVTETLMAGPNNPGREVVTQTVGADTPDLANIAGYYPPSQVRTNSNAQWVPDNQLRLAIQQQEFNGVGGTDDYEDYDGDNFASERDPQTSDYVRIDIWGPSSFNPGWPNAGITNPESSGTYTFCLSTDEEYGTGMHDPQGKTPETGDDGQSGWLCVPVVVDNPLPVRLYRKRQVPLANCNYTELEYIDGFEKIQDALDAADDVWLGTGDYTDETTWNLFDGCPNFSDVCDPYHQPGDACEFVSGLGMGVPVGAVIEVDADANDDGEADVYTETLTMDTPGVILSTKPTTDVKKAVIKAPATTEGGTPVVDITAGAVTLGKAEFHVDKDRDGVVDDEPYALEGFTITNPITDSIGVDITADGWKCMTTTFDTPSKVYDPNVIAYGTPTSAMMSVLTDTIVITDGNWLHGTFGDVFTDGNKLVDLNLGWNGHISDTVVSDGDDVVTFTLWAGGYYSQVLDLDQNRFAANNPIAVFAPSDTYTCPEARIDIRNNVIHDILDAPGNAFTGMGHGIKAQSVAVWVDSNDVYDNAEDGFYGEDLFGCGALKPCNGITVTNKMLEISNNAFHGNGDGDCANDGVAEDWACTDSRPGCFDPLGDGNESGIHIVNTLQDGVGWDCGDGDASSNLYIHDNLVQGNVDAGIWLGVGAANAGVRILWNDLFDNGVFGLSSHATEDKRGAGGYLEAEDESDWYEPTNNSEVDVLFRYNDVTGNGNNYAEDAELEPSELEYTGWGVKNWAVDEVEGAGAHYFNAKENFWNFPTCEPGSGDTCTPDVYPGGPSRGPEPCAHELDQRYPESDMRPLGMGDAVNKGTFYNPWLAYEEEYGGFIFSMDFDCDENWKYLFDEPEAQQTRPYGSDSLMLQEGWNTLAVPLPLNPNYNTGSEICDLGTFLTNEAGEDGLSKRKYEIIYEYDAGDGGWGTAPTLMGTHGYYIKMHEATRFPVIYGAETPVQMPSFSLFADDPADDYKNGWNLVGAPFGIDGRDYDMWQEQDDPPVEVDQGRYAVADPDEAWNSGNWDFGQEDLSEIAVDLEWTFELPFETDPVLNMYYRDDWYQLGEAWMPIKFAFNAIDPAGASGGAANIASPGVTGQIDGGWSLPWDAVEGSPLFAGQAYWVFMREDGALGGFEGAPLFFDDILAK